MVNWYEYLLHIRRALPVVLVRSAPIPWRWKRWLIWAVSPRHGIGVLAVVTDDHGRVLSLRSAYSGRWQLPGGGVKYGERMDAAVRREAAEEIGLDLRDLRMVALIEDTAGRGLHAIFRARLLSGPIRLSEEHTEWRYLEPGTLSPFLQRCLAHALRPVDSYILVDRVTSAE